MAVDELAPAEFLSQEQYVSAPPSADFYSQELVLGNPGQAPKDKLTGLPLSIFYGPEHLGLPLNYQHGWHSAKRLREGLPFSWASALRSSAGYLIPEKYHDETSAFGYHAAIKDGPKFSTGIEGVFSAVGLGISGVVPRLSINLTHTPGEYSIKELDNEQYRFISDPARAFSENEYHIYLSRQASRDKIGRFFTEYSILSRLQRKSLSPIEEEVLLDPTQPLTKELGALVYKASRESLIDLMPPVIAKYEDAKEAGSVNRVTDAQTKILSFMPEHRFGVYYYAVRNKLSKNTIPLQTGVNELVLEAA